MIHMYFMPIASYHLIDCHGACTHAANAPDARCLWLEPADATASVYTLGRVTDNQQTNRVEYHRMCEVREMLDKSVVRRRFSFYQTQAYGAEPSYIGNHVPTIVTARV